MKDLALAVLGVVSLILSMLMVLLLANGLQYESSETGYVNSAPVPSHVGRAITFCRRDQFDTPLPC